MTKYLISGGAGFLGSHLIERILAAPNCSVLCLDNLITGKLENIAPLLNRGRFEFIEQDITESFGLAEKFDYVINLASPASPPDYQNYPLQTLEVASLGTKNMLEIARQNKARFLHASTSEVYGDPKEHPQKESYWGNVNPYGERSCYDEGKRFAEAMIYNYRRQFNLNTVIIRIFNTYGPRMRPHDGRVVSTFIRQALANEEITIFGRGHQTRSFCYVDDQIEAQSKIIHSKLEGPVNIGNPTEFTILELAQKIIALTNSKSKITFRPLPPDDPNRRQPDITVAKEKLNWQPRISLDEGLKKTIKWFKGCLITAPKDRP